MKVACISVKMNQMKELGIFVQEVRGTGPSSTNPVVLVVSNGNLLKTLRLRRPLLVRSELNWKSNTYH
jgi:hypothetical protein